MAVRRGFGIGRARPADTNATRTAAPTRSSPARITSCRDQVERRRIAGRFRKPEMAERMAGEQPPARRALHEAALDEERLDDVLDGVARFGERRRECIDPDRAAAVMERDRLEIAAIHRIEAGAVDLELDERAVGGGAIDRRR